MANDVSSNPVYIDSVGVLFKQRFKFLGGIWAEAAAGNTLEMMDSNGKFVFRADYPTTLQPVPIPVFGWVHGLSVTTISGGNAQIYVSK